MAYVYQQASRSPVTGIGQPRAYAGSVGYAQATPSWACYAHAPLQAPGIMYKPRVPAQAARPLSQGAQSRRAPAQPQPPSGRCGPVQSAASQGAAQSSTELIPIVQNLLQNRGELKTAVVKTFKKLAGTSRKVDMDGLMALRLNLSNKLGIPEEVFGTIQDEYIRFDFDGSGYLEANEVYKLVKWHLYEYLQSIGHQMRNDIAFKSLQQAGYTTTRELGQGSQAVLKLACDRHGNQRCVKCYKKVGNVQFGNLSDMQDEFETMQLLACKNIARTFEMFQDQNFVYMVNEVYHGGDFTRLEETAVSTLGQSVLTEDWWRHIFRQCFEALQFMHQQAMMHCDIKEPNLMLRTTDYANPQVVLIDFGVSKAMTAKDTGSCSGTPGYMPPETMNSGKWYPGGDIFSMGVVMFQLLTRTVPNEEKARKGNMIGLFLEGCRDLEDVKLAVNTRQPQFRRMPSQWPGLRTLTMRCLETNLRSRPKAPSVLKDAWFGGMTLDKTTPTERSMSPSHPMATVGITDELLEMTPAGTVAIVGDFSADKAETSGTRQDALLRAPLVKAPQGMSLSSRATAPVYSAPSRTAAYAPMGARALAAGYR